MVIYIYTNGGGMGVLTADYLESFNINLEETPDDIKIKLKEKLPYFASLRNPIDTTANATEDQYIDGLKIILEDLRTEAILAILLPQLPHYTENIVEKIVQISKNKNTPIFFVIYGGDYSLKIKEKLEKYFLVFDTPEEASKALLFYLKVKNKYPY
ncbi:MAG: hypothetical protein QW038_02375 [Nanopusillaceae archaeon]